VSLISCPQQYRQELPSSLVRIGRFLAVYYMKFVGVKTALDSLEAATFHMYTM
jgi:hypothetical protein